MTVAVPTSHRLRHSEICAVPSERLDAERELLGLLPSLRPRLDRAVFRTVDKLSCVRVGSARYSVPIRLIGQRVAVEAGDGRIRIVERLSGEVVPSIVWSRRRDQHPRRALRIDAAPPTTSAPRSRTPTEREFLALGPIAEAFLTGAAAAGVNKLATEIADVLALERYHGGDALVTALGRAVKFRRWRAADVRPSSLPAPASPSRGRLGRRWC